MTKIPKVVTIGGGTGSYVTLMGLKKYDFKLTAIVTMTDTGGSSGKLRDELGVLPPGDVRQCLVALSESSKLLRDMFNYRFEEGALKGHSFGNIFLSTLEKNTGSMKKSISEIGKILRIKGSVVPITFTKNTNLCVDLSDGKTIVGETHIDVVEKMQHRARIVRAYLKPEAQLNNDAKLAIEKADFIVIGPGDLYTSIIPNILVKDVPNVIKSSKAKKIFVMNLMTKFGQTTNYSARDHIDALEKTLGKGILNYVLINSKLPRRTTLAWYEEYGEEPVADDLTKTDFKVIRKSLIRDVIIKADENDALRRGIIRHDPEKLAKEIIRIIYG
ncbi:MAG: YvcK family protein [Candidatus Levybacteria bacterium]|nr:YvcK family protein [Candidatus Levybacteria bacterium]